MPKLSDTNLIQTTVDGVDHVAVEQESKWGVGRLRLLVNDDLRGRFDDQARLFNEAVFANDVKAVREHGEGMRKGWLALDRAATDAGCTPLAPEVWEASGPDGVIAIVRTNPEAHAVTREGRASEVWTLDEVARVIVNFRDSIGEAKRVFPGARVIDVRVKSIDWAVGDELPFEMAPPKASQS